ncbi:hypothetical protein ACLB2K_002179 [Fragaria x ananassa]
MFYRKPDSPKARPRPIVDGKCGTPKKQKQCNCKHSRCLKLYCECFAYGIYCDGCNCVTCCINVENEGARRDAVEATLERNPNAFKPKIASSPHGPRDSYRYIYFVFGLLSVIHFETGITGLKGHIIGYAPDTCFVYSAALSCSAQRKSFALDKQSGKICYMGAVDDSIYHTPGYVDLFNSGLVNPKKSC